MPAGVIYSLQMVISGFYFSEFLCKLLRGEIRKKSFIVPEKRRYLKEKK